MACSMLMRGCSFGELSLDHKTVLGGVDVPGHQAEGDFDLLRIALTSCYITHLELGADADKHDGAVLKRLQCAGFDNEVRWLGAEKYAAAHEQSRTQAQITV